MRDRSGSWTQRYLANLQMIADPRVSYILTNKQESVGIAEGPYAE
jgi:hypothetical protein